MDCLCTKTKGGGRENVDMDLRTEVSSMATAVTMIQTLDVVFVSLSLRI